jgi:hypothetical protein
MTRGAAKDGFMPVSSHLVAAHIVEHPAAYLKCGHCQRVVTKGTAAIRRFPGIDVVSCHDCQFERITAALLVVCREVNEGEASAVA